MRADRPDRRAAPAKELFFVGDEFQSIYGFRHADVGVFRERRAAAAQRLSLTENYRSRPEVLAAVNHVFGEEFGDELPAARGVGRVPRSGVRAPGRAARHRQGELPGHGRALAPRRGAARSRGGCASSSTRARRRRARSCSSSRRAPTPSGTRRSCARSGLPTYRATGRRYFGQQQVVDLLMYLRLLRNRYDDEALATVLASPFVGVSNDALVLIRRHAGRRPLFTGIERALPEPLSARGRAARPRLQAALRAARRGLRQRLARAALRARRRRSTTTTWRCSRAGTGGDATRTCAS